MLCSERTWNSLGIPLKIWSRFGVGWQGAFEFIGRRLISFSDVVCMELAEPDRSCSKCNRADICFDKEPGIPLKHPDVGDPEH